MAPRGDAAWADAATTATSGDETTFRRVSELLPDEFVWLVGSLCNFHQIPFEAELLQQRFAAPHTREQLGEALHALGLDTRHLSGAEVERGASGPLGRGAIAVAWLRAETRDELARPAIVVRADHGQATLFCALADNPETMALAEFRRWLSGSLIVTTRRVAEPADPDRATQRPRFGFRWFAPELFKHKRIWRDVLLASAAIQLLALGMPLMTQAIIDKVVVHRTESTLIALGVGLAIFMVFSSAFT